MIAKASSLTFSTSLKTHSMSREQPEGPGLSAQWRGVGAFPPTRSAYPVPVPHIASPCSFTWPRQVPRATTEREATRSNIAFPNLAPEVRQRHLCRFDPLEIRLRGWSIVRGQELDRTFQQEKRQRTRACRARGSYGET